MEALKWRRGQELKIIEKIARLKTMLEWKKKMDETKECMEHLKEMVEAGRINLNKFAYEELSKYEADLYEAGKAYLKKAFYEELQEEISKCEDNTEQRIQSFVENAIKYNVNWKNV